MHPRKLRIAIALLSVAAHANAHATAAEDEHIRQIVQGVLKEKDQKIEQLEARIKQLEQERSSAVAATPSPAVAKAGEPAPAPLKTAANGKPEPTVDTKLQALDKKKLLP